ncbi:MAG TPA: cryptochrome/photolyase family protein [Oligoflexus sp.]|uniref:cryptochrome/photolyase family protein n=1 Tax=Oligoflexus sp. TaxID=1971216 RepID=UPI002D7FEA09|nr:cryptochrome/photolyase family protein [Oligoflexus sp.]HET9239096.1 cryptochrome/photolyase family protein [Oligoflexus sp.]
MDVMLVLGNQLFNPELALRQGLKAEKTLVYMREDRELCTHFRYHQQKIVLFLAAMRGYAEELRSFGFRVHYEPLGPNSLSYDDAFSLFLKENKVERVFHYEIEDKFFETRIRALLASRGVKAQEWESPMFLTPRPLFQAYLKDVKKPFMKTFYERQRQRLNVLVDAKKKPLGGKWSYDEENRLSLPKDHKTPALPAYKPSKIETEVITLVAREFEDHPGRASEFWIPTTREGARSWLDDFLKKRLEEFGPYEDALPRHSPFVYHSLLTPFLNLGLLTPAEVLRKTLDFAENKDIPLNSLEGFVRQVMGWREFVRGIYQNFSERQDSTNYWKHTRRLTSHWYEGNTGIQPLDDAIQKTLRYGYAHHIERLMVIGNLMLLLEVDPREAHRWFMEMFLDSSDWVMGPNVYGMALFSDGGIFATKPYICGSNYYRKMGPYKTGSWQPGVDGLYWGFIAKHRDFFTQNPRLGMMVRTLDKMDPEKVKLIAQAADELRARLTQ